MAGKLPLLSRETAPIRPKSVETLTPWSDVLLEELRTAIELNPPPRIIKRYGFVSQNTWRSRMRKSQSKALWLAVLVLGGIWWAMQGSMRAQETAFEKGNEFILPNLAGLKFIDANNPNIRYVGRWVSASDGLHKDGSFPGVYFDIVLNNTSTVLVSLYNSGQQNSLETKRSARASLPFLLSTNTSHAAPISLLVRVDDNEYVVLPNTSSIVSIREGNLDPLKQHSIRIIAPMVGGDIVETLQLEGIWIDQKGRLLPFDSYESDKNAQKDGLQVSPDMLTSPMQRKMLEIVTDMPGSLAGKDRHKSTVATRSILSGVMGWEYLLGEMFGADHVMVGMEGMCLTEDCKGGRGSPAGLADVFFQSGPVGSEQYSRPWLFPQYIPDVMIMNIGNSDWESFQTYSQEYNKTFWELSVGFEETYMSMIKTIRTLAYPKYTTSIMGLSRLDYTSQRLITDVPIFVMRPFRGQLEQSTHSVVDRLRMEGDKNLFWLDTSGWLNTEIDFGARTEDQDFFLDDESPRKQWQLTERGNQRVSILLHMHVCRYLAHDVERCAFLPAEIYEGNAIDTEARIFEDSGRDE